MILSWQCQQCGWMNDNNGGACRRCGGDEDAKGRPSILADQAKIKAFDGVRKAQNDVQDGGMYDRRR